MSTMRPFVILLSLLLGGLAGLTLAAFDAPDALAQIVIPDDGGGDDKQTKKDRGDKKDRGKKDRGHKDDAPTCREGQLVNDDTDGHCCWPGQAWNGERCVGAPTRCPDGWRADVPTEACMPATCAAGTEMVDDEHCCWGGQAWSSSRGQCVGRPAACPGGTLATEDDCLPDGDGDGIADADDQCPMVPEVFDGVRDDDGCPDALEAELEPELPPEVDDVEDGGSGIGAGGIAGYVTLGLGVAMLGGGVGLHFAAEARRDDVRGASTVVDDSGNEVRDGITQREALDAESEANSLDTTGAILMGVGGAAIATGIALVVLDALASTESDPALSVAPGLLPDGGGALVIGGRF